MYASVDHASRHCERSKSEPALKIHVFLSVHELLFGAMARHLSDGGTDVKWSGFAWGTDQLPELEGTGARFEPVTVFTRDVLSQLDDTPADTEFLSAREKQFGVPLQHMIFAERHLVAGRTHDQVLRLAELLIRRVEDDLDTIRPDVLFSEDVSCLTSYIHWAVAKARGIKIVYIGSGRFPGRVTHYANPLQQWDLLAEIFPDTPQELLSAAELDDARKLIAEFRERPTQYTGIAAAAEFRVGNRFDLRRLALVTRRYLTDPGNPTMRSSLEVVSQRATRLARHKFAQARGMFDQPVDGEKFVLFPLHLQPEATTLVLAPYYLDQPALAADVAKSLPVGYKLYVKEHIVCRGRRPLGYYEELRSIPGVRLIGPDTSSWGLLRRASAIAAITGTMGWEGLLLQKPVITFGEVFYNLHPHVHRAGLVAKHQWPALVRRAIEEPRVDDELLVRFVACAKTVTFPGFMANPNSHPSALADENVRNLCRVLTHAAGLAANS